MVEIDGVVMRECAKHMRATAGDSMDNYTGDNYQIFCEDCIPRLVSTYPNAHANSKKLIFDYQFQENMFEFGIISNDF